MTIPCNYWVNIAKDGKFFGTVELKEGLASYAKQKYEEIAKRFPASEGWECELHYTTCFTKVSFPKVIREEKN